MDRGIGRRFPVCVEIRLWYGVVYIFAIYVYTLGCIGLDVYPESSLILVFYHRCLCSSIWLCRRWICVVGRCIQISLGRQGRIEWVQPVYIASCIFWGSRWSSRVCKSSYDTNSISPSGSTLVCTTNLYLVQPSHFTGDLSFG